MYIFKNSSGEHMEDVEETTPKELTLPGTARWVVGILLFIAYFGTLVERYYLAAVFSFLGFMVLIPPISQTIEQKFNFTMSGALRFALVFCLFTGFAVAIPHSPLDVRAGSISSPAANYHIITSWSGNSIKNTETFHVSSDEWKISWNTKPGARGAMNFQIYIYNSDGSLKSVAANVIGQSSDHTIMRGSGDYHLSINTAQPYEITVESLQ